MHHERNRMAGRYELNELCKVHDELSKHIKEGPKGPTVDFSNSNAVKALNTALIKYHYSLAYWEIPDNYLCPAVPGRLDYVQAVADLMSEENKAKVPKGDRIIGLDVGTGSSCIYAILAHKEFGWQMIGSDIDPVAVKSAKTIVRKNKYLDTGIQILLQPNSDNFFKDIVDRDEHYDFSMCNPPFFKTMEEAEAANIRKTRNLTKSKKSKINRNYGGQHDELVYPGGEKKFIQSMIKQSRSFSNNVLWFTCLVSSKSHMQSIYDILQGVGVEFHKTKEITHGNKSSRVICWTFLTKEQRKNWVSYKWRD